MTRSYRVWFCMSGPCPRSHAYARDRTPMYERAMPAIARLCTSGPCPRSHAYARDRTPMYERAMPAIAHLCTSGPCPRSLTHTHLASGGTALNLPENLSCKALSRHGLLLHNASSSYRSHLCAGNHMPLVGRLSAPEHRGALTLFYT